MSNVEFLNIDLDLESENDLSLLIQELGDSVVIMNNESVDGVHRVSLELAGLVGNPEYILDQYFSVMRKLSIESRSLWDGCRKKEFDLGFESEYGASGSLQETISIKSINSLSSLGASVAITIYALPQEGN